ncbi:hypothetical protein [Streptomyces platensis]|uniref:hypothetical protein n=1 Tax=Streptomyces platensis TaxID=58346 RepID=UPI002E81A70E|nr:hypothetical protein [Streptomyces platensis]WUB82384.1 hypothetical protein OG424_26245 [Streptomyces platensis]
MLKERTLLVTVTLPPDATFTQAVETLGLAVGEVDAEYGLVPIDGDQGRYVLLVAEGAAARLEGDEGVEEVEGVYSNPKIYPYK